MTNNDPLTQEDYGQEWHTMGQGGATSAAEKSDRTAK